MENQSSTPNLMSDIFCEKKFRSFTVSRFFAEKVAVLKYSSFSVKIPIFAKTTKINYREI